MNNEIESGDVFLYEGVRYVCKERSGGYVIYAGDNPHGIGFREDICRLVAKANPFQPASQPPKSWQFRHEPWVPKQPETLADCPENVPVILSSNGLLMIKQRRGSSAFNCGGNEDMYLPCGSHLKFIRYLDPPPPQPLSLDDVPDGRVIQVPGETYHFWKHDGNWHEYRNPGGWIRSAARAAEFTNFTITDYIAEFKGPEGIPQQL